MEAYRLRIDEINMPSTVKSARVLKVILDSNALFVPLQFKIDIFEALRNLLNRSFELVLLSPILHEIERLAKEGSPKTRKDAEYALELAERCKLVEVNEIGVSPDDIIVEVAGEWSCPVFTNDIPLRKRLRDINVPVIYVRQKSRLEIEGRS
jgi:rRNA-processing protein FCF1